MKKLVFWMMVAVFSIVTDSIKLYRGGGNFYFAMVIIWSMIFGAATFALFTHEELE